MEILNKDEWIGVLAVALAVAVIFLIIIGINNMQNMAKYEALKTICTASGLKQ